MRKRLASILFCFILCIIFSIKTEAEEFTSDRGGLDVMFAVDSSGSMVSNDPQRIGMAMVKAFIDTVHIENIRIGFASYSDQVGTVVSPVSITDPAAREELKTRIDGIAYSGDTDMGLGLEAAMEAMPADEGRKRIVLVISDGETDLPEEGEQAERESEEKLMRCAEACAEEGISIYGAAFAQYDGSRDSLTDIAELTGGEVYQVSRPEDLIEILYGIFENHLSYKIQLLSSGVYGEGEQELRVTLDEPYLDEMDMLLISSGAVGETSLFYGEKEIPLTISSNYGVGKIGYESMDDSVREMTLTTATASGQSLALYLISYRELLPVFSIEENLNKNQTAEYQVYLKDRQGQIITDEDFYGRFRWELTADGEKGVDIGQAAVKEGVLSGEIRIDHSGTFRLDGTLSDQLGEYPFEAEVHVANTPPSGNLSEIRLSRTGSGTMYELNDYFQDADGDTLSYTLEKGDGESVQAEISGDVLRLIPSGSGRQTFTLLVSDGEDTLSCPLEISVTGWWNTYWWVILPVAAAVCLILFKLLYKPKPQVEIIAHKKQGNRFAGKMDAYVTAQPEGSREIPPLTFPMYKIRDPQVCMGDLMREYPELVEALRLDQIFLIADEGRRMILYHSSPSTLMAGSSILCRQIQYSLGFGDIIYITAPDGAYELEIHYIAVIQ